MISILRERSFRPLIRRLPAVLSWISISTTFILQQVFSACRKGVHYYPRIGFNGIDTSGTAVLEYPDFHAVLSGAKDSDSPGYAIVQGEKGYIKVNGIPSQVAELTVRINGETRTFTENRSAHRMVDEMLEFDRILTEEDWEKADRLLEHSLTVMKILETARKSGGIHFPADEA